jgi:23S rRNA (adenine2503-C2)-methyltransferase
MNSVYDIQSLERICRDPYPRRQFCNAYFKKALPVEDCLKIVPAYDALAFQAVDLAERHDSKTDGATKLLFSCRSDGARVEAVIMRIASGRTSLCISSQVGCAAGCGFCATGSMGFIRNLSVAEILDQVLLARRLLHAEGRKLRNVVLMGMGEPLHNEENVYEALERLRDPRYFNLAETHLMVSTVGVADAMTRFAQRFPRVRLALSLHSARQDVREQLMPIGKVQTLDRLKTVLSTLESSMIEYLLLKGINDGPEDLEALKTFLSGLDARVNLIQFNAHPGAIYQPVSLDERKAFGDALKEAGFRVTLRYSLGDDIAAACGQLAGAS